MNINKIQLVTGTLIGDLCSDTLDHKIVQSREARQ